MVMVMVMAKTTTTSDDRCSLHRAFIDTSHSSFQLQEQLAARCAAWLLLYGLPLPAVASSGACAQQHSHRRTSMPQQSTSQC
jgi:hypothetical protein